MVFVSFKTNDYGNYNSLSLHSNMFRLTIATLKLKVATIAKFATNRLTAQSLTKPTWFLRHTKKNLLSCKVLETQRYGHTCTANHLVSVCVHLIIIHYGILNYTNRLGTFIIMLNMFIYTWK